MQNYTTIRNLVFLCLVALLWSATLPAVSIAAPYDSTIGIGFDSLKQGKLKQASDKAQAAIKMNPRRYEGHFLNGIISYRRDLLEDADAQLQKALDLAPPDKKAQVQDALTTVKAKRNFLLHNQAGMEAEKAGLFAKAAREYGMAWEAMKTEEETGLKAAQLWAEKSNNPIAGAVILRAIMAQPRDTTIFEQAKDLLSKLKPRLEQLAKTRMAEGEQAVKGGRLDEAAKCFREAADATPENPTPHWALARVYAAEFQSSKKEEALNQCMAELGLAFKTSPTSVPDALVKQMAREGNLLPLADEPKFLIFLNDVHGTEFILKVQKALIDERQRVEAARLLREQEDRRLNEAFNSLQSDMVFVKGGCFDMGAPSDYWSSAPWNPIHEVCVSDFYMAKYEITEAQFEAVMGEEHTPNIFKRGSSHPRAHVSWNDVQRFLQKLNARTGKTFRLPTEAEWEYAARSGGKRERFAGSSNESDLGYYAWHNGNSTHPVGQKKPNGLGIYDMSGNLREWCNDWFSKDYYRISPRDNPQGPSLGTGKVVRGGAYGGGGDSFETSYRWYQEPKDRTFITGFRIALSSR